MKFWKIFVVLVLPYFILGCCKCADYITVSEYSYCSLTADNIDTALAKINPVSLADSIQAKNYGFRLFIKTTQGTCKTPTTIFTSAYACKCDEPYLLRPLDTVISFRIITTNNFDNMHLAGDTVTSYFQQFFGEEYSAPNEFVSTFLSKERSGFNVIPNLPFFDLKLMTLPSNFERHSFKIEMELSDNRLLTATTKEVYLN